MSPKDSILTRPPSVADAAERERVAKVLEKRKAKGAGSLTPREIAAVRKYERRMEEEALRRSLASVPQGILTELLQTDRRVVLDWERDGLLRNREASRLVTYDLFVVLPWLKYRWIDEGNAAPIQNAEARERWELARAEEKEIQVARLKEELISLADVERGRVERVLAVKAALLALPRLASPILAALDDRRDIEERLTVFVVNILEGFAGTREAKPRKRKKKKKTTKKKMK